MEHHREDYEETTDTPQEGETTEFYNAEGVGDATGGESADLPPPQPVPHPHHTPPAL